MGDRNGWPFGVGDRVRATDDWGPLICDLSIRAKDHPHAEYTVHAVGGTPPGRWLSLRDDDGEIYGDRWWHDPPNMDPRPCYGPTYFEMVAPHG